MKLLLHELAKRTPTVDFSSTVPVVISRESDIDIYVQSHEMPFKSMSFEALERYPILDCGAELDDDMKLLVYCYHITELSPSTYEIILMARFSHSNNLGVLRLTENTSYIYDIASNRWDFDNYGHSSEIYNGFVSHRWLFLSAMYDKKMQRGTVKPRSTMIGKGKKRRKYTPKDYIVVAPSDGHSRMSKSVGRNITWDHSWRVSGHWRRLPEGAKIKGKDRDGNRTVEGLTWIPEHIKGDGPEIIKARIVR